MLYCLIQKYYLNLFPKKYQVTMGVAFLIGFTALLNQFTPHPPKGAGPEEPKKE